MREKAREPHCPHCDQDLTDDEVKKIWGVRNAKRMSPARAEANRVRINKRWAKVKEND